MEFIKACLNFRFFESLITYHAFFTLLLAQGAWLLKERPVNAAWLAVILVVYYFLALASVLVVALTESEKRKKMRKIYFALGFLGITVVACFINFEAGLFLFAMTFGVSFVLHVLRCCTDYKAPQDAGKIESFFGKIFQSRAFYLISRFIVVFGTTFIFAYYWLLNSAIPGAIRLIVFVLYQFAVPLYGIFEDVSNSDEAHERVMKEYLESQEAVEHRRYRDKFD